MEQQVIFFLWFCLATALLLFTGAVYELYTRKQWSTLRITLAGFFFSFMFVVILYDYASM